MDLLKKFWPVSFKLKEKEVKPFVVTLVIYVVAGFIAGVLLGILGLIKLPLLGVILGLVGTVVDVYCTAGIVFAILKFVNVFKD